MYLFEFKGPLEVQIECQDSLGIGHGAADSKLGTEFDIWWSSHISAFGRFVCLTEFDTFGTEFRV